ncbi:MAG: winged helix-turn-helix transcriptional regulator [Nitrospinae bacterium]|nr:winged helix-turn-helix transcriptional regulator [Nitrospinota bacterium]
MAFDNTMDKDDKKSLHAHYKEVADDLVAIQILGMIENGQEISQRKITAKTGLAAGLVHSYMRKVINKGWVKARQVSPKRWLYYLTPEGFLEKSQLTLKYFSITFQNYRAAQALLKETVQTCVKNGWKRLVIAGENDLSDIAALNIYAMGDELVLTALLADIEKDTGEHFFYHFEKLKELEFDKVLVCDAKFLEWWKKTGGAVDDPRLIHLSNHLSV